MEPSGILSLPEEVIHIISTYLPIHDVLSCSLTCHFLRNALNQNHVWKRFLPEGITQLESQEQLLQQPVVQLGHNLTPLCNNRMHFLRKTCLKNNWIDGKFVSQTFQDSTGFHPIPSQQMFYDNRYLFVSGHVNSLSGVINEGLKVWDVAGQPRLCTTLKLVSFESFQITGSNLVLFNHCKVMVFEIKLCESVLSPKYSFLVNAENVVYSDREEDLAQPPPRNRSFFKWSHTVIGHFLISFQECKGMFFVWNILDPSLVGVFSAQCDKGISGAITFECFSGDNFMLKVDPHYSRHCHFLGFNLTKSSYLDFILESKREAVQDTLLDGSNFVTIVKGDYNHTLCTVYDIETSKQLTSRQFGVQKSTNVRQLKVVNSKFLLADSDFLDIISVSTLETLYSLPVAWPTQPGTLIDVFGTILVAVYANEFSFEIWNPINHRMVLKLPNKYIRSHVNGLGTKLVCCELKNFRSVTILNFW